MKRFIDLSLAILIALLFLIPMILIALLIRLTSSGQAIYWSKRVGYNNNIFNMPKFRTMRINSPVVATHLIKNIDEYYSPIGSFLRRTSLDELPQIFSVLKGDMSIVGPRPALFNQDDLIQLRKEKGIMKLLPGITGWAQVNGRDDLSIPEKVYYDKEYLDKKSFKFDLKIIFLTIFKVIKSSNISH
ncbi:sugar transferase [Candidatus Pseudothioglobus singularis]|jgi:O-antigen biosynthesis protein WbqP|uniref:Sugar transferase n=1 Tax=Candidatus Pseudothioglobus singularis PS1 TaxID=1125411 RepID=A0A0M4LG60_9GAMM|nr:sugar transferase [Candidatus Pseudothioglobus singularis]ALE02293.1 sugar transferase [Candidatus Pseudothioglobus singularis PS1]